MTTKLYVGSLSYAVTDNHLETIFNKVGTVISAKIIMDRISGRSKGFGFVEMSNVEEAQNAVNELNGASIDNRVMLVSLARPQTDSKPRKNPGFDRHRSSHRHQDGYR